MRQLTLFSRRPKTIVSVLRFVLPAAVGAHFAFWLLFFTKTYVAHLGSDAITSTVATALILTWYSIKVFWLETLALGVVVVAFQYLPVASRRAIN